MNCGLIIPTLNAGAQFRTLLEQLTAQTLPTQKLIVDSESTDGTAELAKNFGVEVLTIPRRTFNHGATRQFALEHLQKKFPLVSGFSGRLAGVPCLLHLSSLRFVSTVGVWMPRNFPPQSRCKVFLHF